VQRPNKLLLDVWKEFSALIAYQHIKDDGCGYSTKANAKTPTTCTFGSLLHRMRFRSGRRWSTDL